ncbi:low specificity L-threonine aldolase [Salinibacterium sp. G-O1]|uniref:threonine aldolase family protein n=1 Tax=Salinibacterium sp. G-O1 TaxID=3046208 RepID=UPI0024BB7A01|nr:low specificity L-threonine aldolase [Salinibacterium sp. G-O1]MDJ0335284.1 low specificity L-threonine aldolase [Salinibacterium sp. G-O1]
MNERVFSSDNTAGVSPEILAAIVEHSAGPAAAYGADAVTARVTDRLRDVFERDLDLLVVSTGSAANGLALAALTPPWGAVFCHSDSHVNNDEAGAPEFFTNGAKLIALPGDDAKLNPEAVSDAVVKGRGDVHSVQPAVVSITQATETGSVYSVNELERLGSIAHDAGLAVHMDGARFTNALVTLGVSPAEMTWRAGVDILSFGATKNGTMNAEAVVVFDRTKTAELRYRQKRAGQLASKMRFQSAQLDAYLTNDLWLSNARHANAMAARLALGLQSIPGASVVGTPRSNMFFATLPEVMIASLLSDGFVFHHDRWEPGRVRFVTAFSTTEADVDELIAAMTSISLQLSH